MAFQPSSFSPSGGPLKRIRPRLPTRQRSSASRPSALFPARASTARRSTRDGTAACRSSRTIASCCTRRSSGRTAGCSRPRPAFTEPTISNAPSSPRWAWRQLAARRGLSDVAARFAARGLRRREHVHAALREKAVPPVKGFWSLTMYDEQLFFVANPINRYSMSLRTNPKLEPDGSLVILIQNENPGTTKKPIGCRLRRANSTLCCVFTGRTRTSLPSSTDPGSFLP